MEELKPCPLCGGPAELKKYSGWYVRCKEPMCCVGIADYKTKECAIETWNNRKPSAQQQDSGLVPESNQCKYNYNPEEALRSCRIFMSDKAENRDPLSPVPFYLLESILMALCSPSKPSEHLEHDISVHGVYIEKDGKRIDPKDFYKPTSPTVDPNTKCQHTFSECMACVKCGHILKEMPTADEKEKE